MSPNARPLQWRSLEQLADTPAFRRFVETEWPALDRVPSGPQRRQFLKLMAASFALSGLAGCGDDYPDPRKEEVPFVNNPERMEPSAQLDYASVTLLDGFANGVLVTTRDGRPLKVEGNPQHPWSRGGTDVFGQASILDLYDPARSQTVRNLGEVSAWLRFRGAMAGPIAELRGDQGAGLRLLTGPVSSPSLLAQIAALRSALPQMHWHAYSPVTRDAVYEGTQMAFGRPLEPRWRFERAHVVVALDGDFLDPGPHQVGVARDWITARQASASGELLTLHAAGSVPNLTWSKADYPVTATPSEIEDLAEGLLGELTGAPGPAGNPVVTAWRTRAVAGLQQNRGASLVVAGSTASPRVQELVHRINGALGNIGQSVFYTAPAVAPAESLADLVTAMTGGSVEALVMLGVNPAYDAPASMQFEQALSRVKLKVHAALYEDETALRCDWHVPLAHPLESWGDARSFDGTVGLMQPTIAPLFNGVSAPELMSAVFDTQPMQGQDLLKAFWRGHDDDAAFAKRWETMLNDGFVAGSAFPAENVTLTAAATRPAPAAEQGLTAVFRPDPTVWDGSRANNAWLQELPKPLTKLTWDNAVYVSPALAVREMLGHGDVVAIELDGRKTEGPVWILPGQADGVVGVTLGYGRFVHDMLSAGIGYNGYALRGADPWRASGVTLTKTGRSVAFATTQDHNSMEGHDFVRVQHEGEPPVGETTSWTQPTLYDAPRRDADTAWGMVIDLDACIGCNACVVACQAENNIAVVGREQVALGRELHWLRIDRYYAGPAEAPKTHFQPVPCMHCEDAPCEVGCPVEATLHDSQGLNLMVYNRCVGTRACSGYCPYKVRHFNYLDYSAGASPSIALQRNPQVTVRSRGVMEKCTYCVQRIESANIEADKLNRPIPDGRVQTACQGSCPTRAITFGNLNDKGSAVSAARAQDRNYALLGELNTRPRTSYLAERAPRREV